MQDEHFEWDDDEATQNWRDHGVSFEMAREAFTDAFAVEWVDAGQDPSEERYAMIGMVESRLLFIAYAMRGERIRIISARKAEPTNDGNITMKTGKHDWRRFDALTDAEAHAAALKDPDAQPLTDAALARMKPV